MQLVTLTKKSFQKHSFLALSAYESLLSLQRHWDDLLSRRGADYVVEKNELKDGLQSLRGLCLRSFPELLVDIKLAATGRDLGRGMDINTKPTDFIVSVCSHDYDFPVIKSTLQTVAYIKRIPQVQGAIESALYALGDGNWKMGEGLQVGKGNKEDDGTILEHFLCESLVMPLTLIPNIFADDIVATTISSLTTLSRGRRPAFGSIFLLNNVSYLRRHLLLEPADDAILGLISPATSEVLNSTYRTAKAGYFDSNFSPLMQAITDDPKDKSNKSVAKEKFTRFFDLLDELVERHRLSRVLEDDPRARGEIQEEIIMLIIPSFQLFTQKQMDKEFSKSKHHHSFICVASLNHGYGIDPQKCMLEFADDCDPHLDFIIRHQTNNKRC